MIDGLIFDLDTDLFFLALILWVFYRIIWFHCGRGTFHV